MVNENHCEECIVEKLGDQLIGLLDNDREFVADLAEVEEELLENPAEYWKENDRQ